MTSPALDTAAPAVSPAGDDDLDRQVERVAARKDDWVRTPIARRIAYLDACLAGLAEVAEDWAREGCALKGIDPSAPLAGEEWLVGPWATMRSARLLRRALEAGGAPRPPRVRMAPGGRRAAEVLPSSFAERVLFPGVRAEVWTAPGERLTQGAIYREGGAATARGGRVALVLGAGNVSSIPPMDVLYKLFVEDQVCVLKVNPVNEFIGPVLARAFRALVDDGLLAIVHGGADVGARLAEHPLIDTLHVTGSDRTYDAIVWGPPETRADRKRLRDRVNPRPFTAELGCVTPVIVVPGPWSAADIRRHARSVAGMVTQNASFNCNAAKLLVVARDWLQKDAFLRELKDALALVPPRRAYYPGAVDRWRGFVERYAQAEVVGETEEGTVPWTFIPDVPARAGEHALTTEAFCGVLAETEIDADDPRDFLARATRMCNDFVWGTLSATLLVHPSTARDHRAALDKALAELRYGAIGVNCWSAMAYALGSTSWGAFPGHPPENIQSGTGVVHNAWLFDRPEKSVVYAPWRMRPEPLWTPLGRAAENLGDVARALVAYEAEPSLARLLNVARTAL